MAQLVFIHSSPLRVASLPRFLAWPAAPAALSAALPTCKAGLSCCAEWTWWPLLTAHMALMQMLCNEQMPTTPGQQLHTSCNRSTSMLKFKMVVQANELCLEARGPPGQTGQDCQADL